MRPLELNISEDNELICFNFSTGILKSRQYQQFIVNFTNIEDWFTDTLKTYIVFNDIGFEIKLEDVDTVTGQVFGTIPDNAFDSNILKVYVTLKSDTYEITLSLVEIPIKNSGIKRDIKIDYQRMYDDLKLDTDKLIQAFTSVRDTNKDLKRQLEDAKAETSRYRSLYVKKCIEFKAYREGKPTSHTDEHTDDIYGDITD